MADEPADDAPAPGAQPNNETEKKPRKAAAPAAAEQTNEKRLNPIRENARRSTGPR